MKNPGVERNSGLEESPGDGAENPGDVEKNVETMSTEQRRVVMENLKVVEKNFGKEDEAGLSMETG